MYDINILYKVFEVSLTNLWGVEVTLEARSTTIFDNEQLCSTAMNRSQYKTSRAYMHTTVSTPTKYF